MPNGSHSERAENMRSCRAQRCKQRGARRPAVHAARTAGAKGTAHAQLSRAAGAAVRRAPSRAA
eukprot:1908542-Pleurochrysis_carterae.AAC.1